jgi:polyisoprenoid-binding protein YceI
MLNVALAVLTLATTAALPAGSTLSVDAASSALRYDIVHKLHKVHAEAKDIEGKAVAKGDGSIIAMVRAPVAAFRSGDGNRDAHMLEVLEASQHPFVVFKGIARLAPGADLAGTVTMQGEVDFHGVKRPVTVPLKLEEQADGSLHARGEFDVSLDAHRVERPSLLFVKVEDACRIGIDLVLRKSGSVEKAPLASN